MASLNKVQLIGNLGSDPEVRTFPDGARIATVSLATYERWKDRESGETKERTEWHNIVFGGPVVETVTQYLHKGSTVYVEGRLRTRKWQDKDKQDRYTTEVVARSFRFLDKKQGDGVPAGYESEEDVPM